MTAQTYCSPPPPCTGPLEDADDRELAEIARVDADAFGVLYRRYSGQIYRVVYQRLRDREDAEDVTAEVFVKAFRAINDYIPSRAPFWSWLHRIALNTVIDHVRARRPAVSLAVAADPEDPAADVEAQVVRRTEASRIWTAVEKLCTTQRTALTLRLGHDLPIAIIAGHMDRSEGAVRQLINRGLSGVRAELGGGQPPGAGRAGFRGGAAKAGAPG
jgi:RNA polymerase sigma-70 factor (ECF subfamily)